MNADVPDTCGAARPTCRAAGILRLTRQIQCVNGVVRSFCTHHQTRAVQGALVELDPDAGAQCVWLRLPSCFPVSRATLKMLSSTIAPATAWSFAGLEVALRGNLWEDRDEWRMLRAHAPPWHVAPVREIARKEAARRARTTSFAHTVAATLWDPKGPSVPGPHISTRMCPLACVSPSSWLASHTLGFSRVYCMYQWCQVVCCVLCYSISLCLHHVHVHAHVHVRCR